MRLTVFHDRSPEPQWTRSLGKLLDGLTWEDLRAMGHVHLAVFNGGVAGVAATRENRIVYLKVRDITRRRGVGKYLIEETCGYVLADYAEVSVGVGMFPEEERDGVIYFLESLGFTRSPGDPDTYLYRD